MKYFAIINGPDSQESFRQRLVERIIPFTVSEVRDDDVEAEAFQMNVQPFRMGPTRSDGRAFTGIIQLDEIATVVVISYSWDKRSGVIKTTEQRLPGRRPSR